MIGDFPQYIILDVFMFVFLIFGGLVGYYRGALKAIITLLALYLPYLIYLHFSDQISFYTAKVVSLAVDANTSSLGVLGTFSGLMGGIGIFGLFFIASRFIMRLVANHDPELKEKLGGVIAGVTGNQLMALISLMLVFMALPAATSDATAKSLWWKTTKPIARAIFPAYRELIFNRTESLRMSIAEGGLIKGFASGRLDLDGGLLNLGDNSTGLVAAFTNDFAETLASIDIDELQREVEKLVEEGISAEDVDRQIKEEEKQRRMAIDAQLSGQ